MAKGAIAKQAVINKIAAVFGDNALKLSLGQESLSL